MPLSWYQFMMKILTQESFSILAKGVREEFPLLCHCEEHPKRRGNLIPKKHQVVRIETLDKKKKKVKSSRFQIMSG